MGIESFVELLKILNDNVSLRSGIQLISVFILAGGVHRYAINPLLNFHWKLLGTIEQVQVALPILLKIASEFKPNGGNSLRDLFDRMEARQNIADERMLALLRSSVNAYFEADANGRYRWVNRMWCEVTCMVPDDAMGHGWLGTVHPDDQARVSMHWNLCVNQQREFNLEYNIITLCEEKLIIPVKAIAHVLWKDGRKTEAVGFIGSICERKPK